MYSFTPLEILALEAKKNAGGKAGAESFPLI